MNKRSDQVLNDVYIINDEKVAEACPENQQMLSLDQT